MQCAGALAKILRGPWVITGDFNVNPCALKQWALDNRATIHLSTAPTCNSNHYDFFIVHRSITSAVVVCRPLTAQADGHTSECAYY